MLAVMAHDNSTTTGKIYKEEDEEGKEEEEEGTCICTGNPDASMERKKNVPRRYNTITKMSAIFLITQHMLSFVSTWVSGI